MNEFKKTKSLWNKTKTLSLIHTNMCSLQANINDFEDLLHDLDFSFDIVACSETWNNEKSETPFLPKKTGRIPPLSWHKRKFPERRVWFLCQRQL